MKKLDIFFISLFLSFYAITQNNLSFSGDLQISGQTFQEDLLIEAEKRDPNLNSYLNLSLDYKNYLRIGTRLELYKNPIEYFQLMQVLAFCSRNKTSRT